MVSREEFDDALPKRCDAGLTICSGPGAGTARTAAGLGPAGGRDQVRARCWSVPMARRDHLPVPGVPVPASRSRLELEIPGPAGRGAWRPGELDGAMPGSLRLGLPQGDVPPSGLSPPGRRADPALPAGLHGRLGWRINPAARIRASHPLISLNNTRPALRRDRRRQPDLQFQPEIDLLEPDPAVPR